MRLRFVMALLLAVAACMTDAPLMPERQFSATDDYGTIGNGDLFILRVGSNGNAIGGPLADTIDALGDTIRLGGFLANDSTGLEAVAAKWVSVNTARATVSQTGLVTSVAGGRVRIRAHYQGQSFDRHVFIRQVITTFTSSPGSLEVLPNSGTVPLTITALDRNGVPVVGNLRFASPNDLVAEVDDAGVIMVGSEGFTRVRARLSGRYIVPALLRIPVRVGHRPDGFAITPGADTLIYEGETAQLLASAEDPLGNPIPIEWRSLRPTHVAVDSTGSITALASGRARVVARAGLVADTAEILVKQVTEHVVVTLGRDTLEEGESFAAAAAAFDSAGATIPLRVRWHSRDTTIASVDSTGVITGAFEGSTWIVASRTGEADSVEVTVVPAATVSAFLEIPGHAFDSVFGYTLPADGTTQVDFLVTFLDARGNPVRSGGQNLELVTQRLNTHTIGATVSGLTDHGDGTWSAKVTSPTNNGTSGVLAYVNGVYWDSRGITYTGGNNLPVVPPPGPQCSIPAFPTPCSQVDYISWQHVIEDAHDKLLTLPGTDADGQPIAAQITELFALSPVATWKKQDGSPLAVGETINDLAVLFTPHPDGYGPFYARIEYVLTDGLARSDTGSVRVFVDGVNDPPRPTLSSDLQFYEDQTTDNIFLMGGHDPEGNLFRVRFTLRPDLMGGMYHITQSGNVLITPATTTLDGSSDIGFGWPMYFVAYPNDWGEVIGDYYNEFCYVLEEITGGNQGPDNCVEIRVAAVNDQPVTDIAGIGTAVDHNLTTSLIEGGLYTLPAITLTDPDIDISDPEFAVTIALSGSGVLGLETFDYEDALVVFNVSDQLITFAMKSDVTAMGFRPGLTLSNLLSSLTYSAAGGTADTLTITVSDQGGYGVCSPTDHTDPCPKQTITTIDMTIAPGTPPANPETMVLTPAGT